MSYLIKVGLLCFFLLSCLTIEAKAMKPPTKDQLEQYKQDGTLEERIKNTKKRETKVDPAVISDMKNRLKRLKEGKTIVPRQVPKEYKGSPTLGNVKYLSVLIDFPDFPHDDIHTPQFVQERMFGNGEQKLYPYESISNFYERSSYGKLHISGNVLGWYTAKYNRSHYEQESGMEELIKEALEYYEKQGHDFSQYDSDNNGTIDGLYIKWTGPDNGWGSYWWAYQSSWKGDEFKVGGKKVYSYITSWITNKEQDSYETYSPRTDIHETGHLLGLPDYYDYDPSQGPNGGLGGLDMMDSSSFDHNVFSKFLLGWLTPKIISGNGEKSINLHPSTTTPDAVLIMPDATDSEFNEFFMAEYRKRSTGNDQSNEALSAPDIPNDGILIWHIDSRTDAEQNYFLYDNSYTEHKLLKLMEADGKEEIEASLSATEDDFYREGTIFNSTSTPNSYRYYGIPTGVTIKDFSPPSQTMGATFAINKPEVPDPWKEIKTDIPLNKTWTITFNAKIKESDITEENIYITDSMNNKIPVKLNIVSDTKVSITPSNSLVPGTTYLLWVKNVSSEKQVRLKKDIYMIFKTVTN